MGIRGSSRPRSRKEQARLMEPDLRKVIPKVGAESEVFMPLVDCVPLSKLRTVSHLSQLYPLGFGSHLAFKSKAGNGSLDYSSYRAMVSLVGFP